MASVTAAVSGRSRPRAPRWERRRSASLRGLVLESQDVATYDDGDPQARAPRGVACKTPFMQAGCRETRGRARGVGGVRRQRGGWYGDLVDVGGLPVVHTVHCRGGRPKFPHVRCRHEAKMSRAPGAPPTVPTRSGLRACGQAHQQHRSWRVNTVYVRCPDAAQNGSASIQGHQTPRAHGSPLPNAHSGQVSTAQAALPAPAPGRVVHTSSLDRSSGARTHTVGPICTAGSALPNQLGQLGRTGVGEDDPHTVAAYPAGPDGDRPAVEHVPSRCGAVKA